MIQSKLTDVSGQHVGWEASWFLHMESKAVKTTSIRFLLTTDWIQQLLKDIACSTTVMQINTGNKKNICGMKSPGPTLIFFTTIFSFRIKRKKTKQNGTCGDSCHRTVKWENLTLVNDTDRSVFRVLTLAKCFGVEGVVHSHTRAFLRSLWTLRSVFKTAVFSVKMNDGR